MCRLPRELHVHACRAEVLVCRANCSPAENPLLWELRPLLSPEGVQCGRRVLCLVAGICVEGRSLGSQRKTVLTSAALIL